MSIHSPRSPVNDHPDIFPGNTLFTSFFSCCVVVPLNRCYHKALSYFRFLSFRPPMRLSPFLSCDRFTRTRTFPRHRREMGCSASTQQTRATRRTRKPSPAPSSSSASHDGIAEIRSATVVSFGQSMPRTHETASTTEEIASRKHLSDSFVNVGYGTKTSSNLIRLLTQQSTPPTHEELPSNDATPTSTAIPQPATRSPAVSTLSMELLQSKTQFSSDGSGTQSSSMVLEQPSGGSSDGCSNPMIDRIRVWQSSIECGLHVPHVAM